MIRYIFFILIFFQVSKSVFSCTEEKNNASKITVNQKIDSDVKQNREWDDTIKSVRLNNGHKLAYTLLNYSDSSSQEKTSFFVFLHGSGERGVDNQAQLKVGVPLFVQTLKSCGLKNFTVFVPQCPENESWVDTDWKAEAHTMKKDPSPSMGSVLFIMDSLISEIPNIDTNRVYVTGLSMGGFGTWEMIQRRPDFFAAAIPVCGGGDANLGKTLIKMPIWAFHGVKDKAVPVIRTIDMFNNIKKEIGSSPIKIKMQIYESKGHFIWNEVYTNTEVINWLIKQKRD